jgi:membrane peptidoglycan carboxypeptidase
LAADHSGEWNIATQVDSILGACPVVGRTGSSENNTTATFVGFTTQVVADGPGR